MSQAHAHNVSISDTQRDVLFRPINGKRIQTRSQAGRNLHYLATWDVRAHLIRIFGFGGFDAEVVDSALLFCDQNERNQWQASFMVTLRLHIKALDATYTEVAVGSATLPQRGEALDMAVKTAESDALKRAAVNLGDQFGLSLYNNGSLAPVVGQSLAYGHDDDNEEHGQGDDTHPDAIEAAVKVLEDAEVAHNVSDGFVPRLIAASKQTPAKKRIEAVSAIDREIALAGLADALVDIDGAPVTLSRLASQAAVRPLEVQS